MADLKERFANWLIEKANPSYLKYFKTVYQALNSLNEYNEFFEIDLFDGNNVEEIKNILNDTFKDPAFEKTSFGRYSKKKQNHVPRAVLWNQNYFKFLNEVKKMGRMIKSTKKSLREINIEANKDKITRYLNSEKERIVDFIYLNGVRTQIVVDGDSLEILERKHKIKVKYNLIQDKILYSIDLVSHNFSRDMKDWDDEKLIYTVNAQRKEWNPIEKKYLEEFGFQFPYNDKRTILFDISGELTEEDLKKSYMKFVKILIAKSLARGILIIDPVKTSFEEKEPFNLILYGPPGTGKTYHTINKALEIIYGVETVNKSYEDVEKELFNEINKDCSDMEFGVNDSKEEYIKIQNLENNRKKLVRVFEFFKAHQIKMITFHQSYSYEDFVEGIKPIPPNTLENQTNEMIFKVQPGIFRKICEEAKNDLDNDYEYVLIIDEINRGNVASILGELITLIEPDKRIGTRYGMTTKLPYSGEDFGVPANLHIIGTMNTADRSVEALDAALRRRFQFEEMMPRPELFTEEKWKWKNFDIEKFLTTLNKRLEVLLDRDHQIGHSCFMVSKNERKIEKLREIFEYKIIPQLREFFFGDPEKMRLVLGNDFFEQETKASNEFFDVDDLSEYIDDIDKRWVLKSSESWDFASLLGKTKEKNAESDQ